MQCERWASVPEERIRGGDPESPSSPGDRAVIDGVSGIVEDQSLSAMMMSDTFDPVSPVMIQFPAFLNRG